MTCKKFSMKEFSDSTNGIQGIDQTIKWPCKSIILSIGHFECPSEVRLLASNFKTVWKGRLVLSKTLLIFVNGWFENSFISRELTLQEPLHDVMLHSGNRPDCQMALRNDHFVNRTFGGSNWSPVEQLVKGCFYLIKKQSENGG